MHIAYIYIIYVYIYTIYILHTYILYIFVHIHAYCIFAIKIHKLTQYYYYYMFPNLCL